MKNNDIGRRKFIQYSATCIVLAASAKMGFGEEHITMKQFSVKEELSITSEIDVLVVGGGTAGTIAAIQAGRAGAKTLIIERGSQLGGTTTIGSVAFPGIFHDWRKQIISGIGWELVMDSVLLDFESITEGNKNSPLDGSKSQWKVIGRKFTIVPGTPNIRTKETFGDCQLHIEWKTPCEDVRNGKMGQESGNSGIYLMGKYEVQILNSFKNSTSPTRQAGSIYNQHPPLVNAALKPGMWQVFDIIFTAPKFNADGLEKKPCYFTVFHNGILVQNHVEIKGPSHAGNEKTPIYRPELPLMLQNHQNEVSFRYIWIRKL